MMNTKINTSEIRRIAGKFDDMGCDLDLWNLNPAGGMNPGVGGAMGLFYDMPETQTIEVPFELAGANTFASEIGLTDAMMMATYAGENPGIWGNEHGEEMWHGARAWGGATESDRWLPAALVAEQLRCFAARVEEKKIDIDRQGDVFE